MLLSDVSNINELALNIREIFIKKLKAIEIKCSASQGIKARLLNRNATIFNIIF